MTKENPIFIQRMYQRMECVKKLITKFTQKPNGIHELHKFPDNNYWSGYYQACLDIKKEYEEMR